MAQAGQSTIQADNSTIRAKNGFGRKKLVFLSKRNEGNAGDDNLFAYFLAGFFAAAFVTLWFSSAYRELSAKQPAPAENGADAQQPDESEFFAQEVGSAIVNSITLAA